MEDACLDKDLYRLNDVLRNASDSFTYLVAYCFFEPLEAHHYLDLLIDHSCAKKANS